MTRAWRWGIAGTGGISDSFTRDLALVPGAEVVAVGSRTLDRAAAFAATHVAPCCGVVLLHRPRHRC